MHAETLKKMKLNFEDKKKETRIVTLSKQPPDVVVPLPNHLVPGSSKDVLFYSSRTLILSN
jgi:hypothetical protein